MEIDLIRKGYDLDIYAVFGDDPYTMPLILLTQAWMKANQLEERDGTHLWSYVKQSFDALDNENPPADATYRKIMRALTERGAVERIKIHGGKRPKFDYALTEYGEAVCKKHIDSLHEQIRLEKWRRRALSNQNREPACAR